MSRASRSPRLRKQDKWTRNYSSCIGFDRQVNLYSDRYNSQSYDSCSCLSPCYSNRSQSVWEGSLKNEKCSRNQPRYDNDINTDLFRETSSANISSWSQAKFLSLDDANLKQHVFASPVDDSTSAARNLALMAIESENVYCKDGVAPGVQRDYISGGYRSRKPTFKPLELTRSPSADHCHSARSSSLSSPTGSAKIFASISSDKLFGKFNAADTTPLKTEKAHKRFPSSLFVRCRSSSPLPVTLQSHQHSSLSSAQDSIVSSPSPDKIKPSVWTKNAKLSLGNPFASRSHPNIRLLFKTPMSSQRKPLPPSSLALAPSKSDSKVVRNISAARNYSLPNSPMSEKTPLSKISEPSSEDKSESVRSSKDSTAFSNEKVTNTQANSQSKSVKGKRDGRRRRKKGFIVSTGSAPQACPISSLALDSSPIEAAAAASKSADVVLQRSKAISFLPMAPSNLQKKSCVKCSIKTTSSHDSPAVDSECFCWKKPNSGFKNLKNELPACGRHSLYHESSKQHPCSCVQEALYKCVKCKCAQYSSEAFNASNTARLSAYKTEKSISASSVISSSKRDEEGKPLLGKQQSKPDRKVKNRSLSLKMEDMTRSVQEVMEKTITSPKTWRKSKLGEVLFGPPVKLLHSSDEKKKISAVSDSEDEGRVWSFKLARGKSDGLVNQAQKVRPYRTSSTDACTKVREHNTSETVDLPQTIRSQIDERITENQQTFSCEGTRIKLEFHSDIARDDSGRPYRRQRKSSCPVSPQLYTSDLRIKNSPYSDSAALISPTSPTASSKVVQPESDNKGKGFMRIFQRRRSYTQGSISLMKKSTDDDKTPLTKAIHH